jgi:F-type H+-transporting ATPase subunit alpha
VGGKAQLPCYRAVAGELRLSHAQFEELEVFARFGTRLDDATITTLERGRRVREVFQQPQYAPLAVPDQVAILLAASDGLLNAIPVERVVDAERAIRKAVATDLPDLSQRMESGAKTTAEDRDALLQAIGNAIAGIKESEDDAIA